MMFKTTNGEQQLFSVTPTLSYLFIEAVQQWPNQIAVVCDDQTYTYLELYQHALNFCHVIQAEITTAESNGCIAIYGNKSLESVAGILGILLAGYAYMPIDITWPAERIQAALKTAQPLLLLQSQLNPYLKKQLESITNLPKVVHLEDCQKLNKNNISHTPNYYGDSEKIAYILFTSGTTGFPKGVAVSNRASIAAIDMFFEHIHLSSSDKIINQAALCYDLTMFDLFTAFKVGASIHLIPAPLLKVPKHFIQTILKNELSSLFIVSSSLEYILKYTDDLDYQLPIRHLLLTGDPISNTLFNLLKKRLKPEATIWNLYSAVEMPYAFAEQISLTSLQVDPKRFSKHGSKIAFTCNQEGALIVESPVLFSGYLTEDRSLTHLVQQPITQYNTNDRVKIHSHGIELSGRMDRQVKILGNRIELDDIEMNIESLSLVQEAAVYYDNEKKQLIAFIVVKQKTTHPKLEIKQLIDKQLPAIMHPNQFYFIETMPRTTSGKKDRKKLINDYL